MQRLGTPEVQEAYLKAAFKDDDPALIAAAIGNIGRPRGLGEIAYRANVGQEVMYKSFLRAGISTMTDRVPDRGGAWLPGCLRRIPRRGRQTPHRLRAGLPGQVRRADGFRARFLDSPVRQSMAVAVLTLDMGQLLVGADVRQSARQYEWQGSQVLQRHGV